jgi:hypothetical protein
MSLESGTIGAFSNKLSGQVWVKGRNPSPERTVKRVNLCRTYPERRTTVSALDRRPRLTPLLTSLCHSDVPLVRDSKYSTPMWANSTLLSHTFSSALPNGAS